MKGRPRWSGKRLTRPRTWWTRERVLAGLLRFYRDTGEMPTGEKTYHARVLPLECGLVGSARRYPPAGTVLRHWPSFVEAWRAAGCASSPAFRPRKQKLTGLLANLFGPVEINDKTGRRYGRLLVVGLAGVVARGTWREALWLCACDCGACRFVGAGRFREVRCCLECAAMARRDALAAARPLIPRTATGQYRRRYTPGVR